MLGNCKKKQANKYKQKIGQFYDITTVLNFLDFRIDSRAVQGATLTCVIE